MAKIRKICCIDEIKSMSFANVVWLEFIRTPNGMRYGPICDDDAVAFSDVIRNTLFGRYICMLGHLQAAFFTGRRYIASLLKSAKPATTAAATVRACARARWRR